MKESTPVRRVVTSFIIIYTVERLHCDTRRITPFACETPTIAFNTYNVNDT